MFVVCTDGIDEVVPGKDPGEFPSCLNGHKKITCTAACMLHACNDHV